MGCLRTHLADEAGRHSGLGNIKGIGAGRGRWLERKGRFKAADGLVKRRHMHVGAPDNRINGSLKSMS